jgi:hypothetical protein
MAFRTAAAVLVLCIAAPFTARGDDRASTLFEADQVYESMRDLQAVVRGGTSLNDFTSRLPDLSVGVDRLQRHGHPEPRLDDALKNFREGASWWQQSIEAEVQGQSRIAALNLQLRDSNFAIAGIDLDKFASEQTALKEAEAAASAAQAASSPAVHGKKHKH